MRLVGLVKTVIVQNSNVNPLSYQTRGQRTNFIDIIDVPL